MRHPPGVDAARRHFPKLLYANAIDLRIEAAEIFLRDEVLGQGTARALSEHRDLGAEFVTQREVVLGLPIFVTALVFRDHASDRFALINELYPGELREDVNARLLDKSPEPLHQPVQRDDVIAVIS